MNNIKRKFLIIVFFVTFRMNYLMINAAKILKMEGIIGGIEAYPNQFTYQVSLQENDVHVCGGGIIDDMFILTAAHCFHNINDMKLAHQHFSVVAPAMNEQISNNLKNIYEIDKIYIPRIYKPINPRPGTPYRPRGDIALVKLNRKLKPDKNGQIRKLELPKVIDTFANKIAVLVGQGYNKIKVTNKDKSDNYTEIGSSDGILRFLNTRVMLNKDCKNIYYNPIHLSNLCAAVTPRTRNPKGACFADSGGPLVYNGTIVIGILNSKLIGCNENEGPSIYVRVSFYVHLIQIAKRDQRSVHFREYKLKKKGWFKSTYEFVEE